MYSLQPLIPIFPELLLIRQVICTLEAFDSVVIKISNSKSPLHACLSDAMIFLKKVCIAVLYNTPVLGLLGVL